MATDPRDVNVKDYTSGNGFGDIYLKKDVKAGEELLVGSYHWPKPVIQARESKAWWNQTPKPVRGILWDLVRHDEDPAGTWRYKWMHPSPIPDECKRFDGAIANRTPEENLPVLPYKRIATKEEFIKQKKQREQRESRRQQSPSKQPPGERQSKRIAARRETANEEEHNDKQPNLPEEKQKKKALSNWSTLRACERGAN